jgi:hypothetical protein
MRGETHQFEDEEQSEISNEDFESGINEPQKQIPVVDDQQVNVLPDNEEEEEKEEILLTTTSTIKLYTIKLMVRWSNTFIAMQ